MNSPSNAELLLAYLAGELPPAGTAALEAGRLELSADTTARLERGAAKSKGVAGSRRVFVPEGLLTAVVTNTPMVLATPHAEVRAGTGTVVCNIASAGTSIEPEKGRVQ